MSLIDKIVIGGLIFLFLANLHFVISDEHCFDSSNWSWHRCNSEEIKLRELKK